MCLFLVAINSIQYYIPSYIDYSLFADDLSISISCSSIVECADKINATLLGLMNWSNKTGFKFSTSKTKAIHFSRKRKLTILPIILLYGQPIIFVETHRYLGLILDKKLTWKNHLKKLKVDASRALGILKTLSCTKWGSDRETLIRIFKSLILSKLDYGCIVYSSSNNGLLKSLDPVQNTAIRLSLGAFRSSPVTSLQCEASVMPLNLRRERLVLNHFLKILSIDHHPLHEHCKNYLFTHILNRKPNNPKPFVIRANSYLSNHNIDIPNFPPSNPLPIPFWLLPKVHLNVHLQRLKKRETSNDEYRVSFNRLLEKYSDYKTFYTDGSKSTQGVGSAFFNTDELLCI